MLDAFTTGDTAHIGTIFKFLPHTHRHGFVDILIHTLASPSGINLNYDEKHLSGKKIELFFLSGQVS
jgi:hypothetical protein